jgi:hypothetical protein
VRLSGGTAENRAAGTISEDIEKCGNTIYLVYDQRVAANRCINDRTLLGLTQFLISVSFWGLTEKKGARHLFEPGTFLRDQKL